MSSQSDSTDSARSRRKSSRLVPLAISLALLIAAGLGYLWWRYVGKTETHADMAAAERANLRGVGYMEQFQYEKAVTAFEEVTRHAPDWRPGQINLGIALFNTQSEENLQRAVQLFRNIPEEEPYNRYAHFCLGIIFAYKGHIEEASQEFQAVTRLDPTDAPSWYWYGSQLPAGSDEQTKCFEKAHELNPHLRGALYGLAQNLGRRHAAKQKALLADFQALDKADWLDPTEIKYTGMGPYSEVIGRDPHPKQTAKTGPIPLFERSGPLPIKLRPGARWATGSDFGNDAIGQLRRKIRERFGATMVVLDYDRDGKPDLFLVGAVVEGGKIGDLLLRNDGDGKFTDVTIEAGLGGSHPSLGCCVADFDNDTFPDLFVTGIGQQQLFRNVKDGKNGRHFEDVTAEAGLDQLKTVCLGSCFLDLDQDGDLDLAVAQYAASAEEALANIQEESSKPGPGLAVYLNVGEAKPFSPGEDPPPLTPRFRRADGPKELLGEKVPLVGLAAADLDLSHDLDLFVVADRQPATALLNRRLLRFRRSTLPESLVAPGDWNGALVLDANHDGRSDLFLIGPSQTPRLLLSRIGRQEKEFNMLFETHGVKSPPLLRAVAIDIDYDGWTDIVGLSNKRLPVLLHNEGGKLAHAPEALGSDAGWPKDLVALAVADFQATCFADLMVWSEKNGLELYINKGNNNQALKLELSGHRRVGASGSVERCNADGFGAWAVAQVNDHWTGAENTTLSAGLGQSRQPLFLGLGAHDKADLVRLRWPDNAVQAVFDVPGCRLSRIEETNRRPTSCPLLFAWNGRRFEFVADFLGAGSLGESLPGGGHRQPRPEESVKIEPDQLAPHDGQYVLKIAEPMDEVTYLDKLQLVTIDHPADTKVYPDERFPGAPPTQELLAFQQETFPVKAKDHRGRDMTKKLRSRDRDMVDDFARRSWIGFAEDHWVELDFGDRLAKFGANDRLILCLAGWTDYPYPESIWAAHQAGIDMKPPSLERLGPDGQWQTIYADAGFPAGLPRMTTLDVTGKLTGPRCVLRLKTNMQIYWDQIFIAEKWQRANGKWQMANLDVASATLSPHACMQEFSPDGKLPTIYDHDRIESIPVTPPAGRTTRYGEVTDLLRSVDDRFVIFGPGDELTVRFHARKLPSLPAGWKRSFVLRTHGYCKDSAPFTDTGATVEPLPFRAMKTYPYGPEEHYPRDALHDAYQRQFNTRQLGNGGNHQDHKDHKEEKQ